MFSWRNTQTHTTGSTTRSRPIPPTPINADQSVRDCTIRENENAVLINEATKAPFTYKDECVRIGPTVGADPEALQAATTAVTEFVRSVVAR
jgi:hypothetical protein